MYDKGDWLAHKRFYLFIRKGIDHMQQQTMDALIENELQEGEQLLWFDRPSAKSSLPRMNVFLILCLVFGVIGLVLLAIAGILAFSVAGRAGSAASLALLIIGIVFLFTTILFGIFAVVFKFSPKNLVYAITDQRVMIIRTGNLLTVDSYGKADIGPIRRSERPDGSGDIIFTVSRFPYSYGYGGYGYSGYNYGTYGNYNLSLSSSGRLLGIQNARTVERILRQTLK